MRKFLLGPCLIGSLAVALASGCSGPKLVPAEGQIVSGGQPLKVGNQETLQVILVPEPKGKEYTTYPADVNKEDGKFSVADGVPPGKYRIAVLWLGAFLGSDRLKGKFGLETSPIIQEFSGRGAIDIDLATIQ